MPVAGDVVDVPGARIEALSVEGVRLRDLRVRRLPRPPDSSSATGRESREPHLEQLRVRGTTASGGRVAISLANRVFGRRLRLDVFSPAGALITRIPVEFGAEYRLGQDEVGEVTLSLPAPDSRVALLTAGQRVLVYREGEGKMFSGIVGKCEEPQDADSGSLLAVTGASRAPELVMRNTMTGAS